MKYSFSDEFEAGRYRSCLEEIAMLIEQLRKESGCPVKPMMPALHVGYAMIKRVCPDRWQTSCIMWLYCSSVCVIATTRRCSTVSLTGWERSCSAMRGGDETGEIYHSAAISEFILAPIKLQVSVKVSDADRKTIQNMFDKEHKWMTGQMQKHSLYW